MQLNILIVLAALLECFLLYFAYTKFFIYLFFIFLNTSVFPLREEVFNAATS